MKSRINAATPIVIAAALTSCLCAPAKAAPWITAYLPAWEVTQNGVTPSGIDMNSITDLIWFSLAPTSSGSIVETSGDPGINADAGTVATAVHNAGKKVLISIGGAGTEPAFQSAFNAGKTSTLVNSIVSWVNSNGYDGVDIDDEPLQTGDTAQYQSFINSLRSALGSNKVLTAAAEPYGADTAAFVGLTSAFNQINIMTYDMIYGNGLANGSGEMTWYNSPLSNGGNFEQTGPAMPSIAGAVTNFENAGVPAAKLGIGSAFYGYIFPGTTNIMQAYTGAWPPAALSYGQIMGNSAYYNASYYHYDSASGAAYISRTDSSNFITYDDPTAVAAKVNYLSPHGLGGLVCFEIGQQYMSGQNPLLKAIDSALGGSGGSTTGGGGGGTITAGAHTLTPQCATAARLDDSAQGTANGNKVQIWQANGTVAQEWNFSTSGVSPSGDYNLAVDIGPYCLDASGSTSGSVAELWACDGASAQSWKAVADTSPSGYYQLEPANGSGLCLDVSSAGSANGTQVQVWTCNQTNAQQWLIQ